MSKVLRLCVEEISVPTVLPAWAKATDAAAGRVVATPPSTPPQRASHHDVVPPWALESDERPATGRVVFPRDGKLAFLEETAGKALEAQQAAEAAQQKHQAMPVNPHLIIPAGLKCKRKPQTPRQENLAPSPWRGRRGNTAEAEKKTLELTSARDRTSVAEEEARQARVQLRDKDQQIAPRVVTTKAQRQCGIKDPGGLSHSRQGYIAQLQREKASREEVQVALDAQRERSRYEQAFERQEDKYFAAQAAAHALQLEIQEAEARALWRTKCREVQEDVIQQRQELRARKAAKECEGATGYHIGRDVLGDLRALQQSKLQNAQLRADDLLARRQRKQQEARDAKEEDQAAAEMMLAHANAHHAHRIARRQSCLAKQCAKVLRGEQMEKRGGGIPTGRHKPRHRPTSAEFQAQAEVLRKQHAQKLLQKMRQEEAEQQQKIREVMESAREQMRQREEQRHQELLEQQQERQEMESQAANFDLQQRAEAEQKRMRLVEHAKQVLHQAEEERLRRRLRSR